MILIDQKKVCGILSELSAEIDNINFAVVGIGINVNQQQFPDRLKDIATSLRLSSGQKVNRVNLLQNILLHFEKFYKQLNSGQEKEILRLWKNRLNIMNKVVVINSNNENYKGKAIDISPRGELLIETKKGEILSFWTGDTSLVDYYKKGDNNDFDN